MAGPRWPAVVKLKTRAQVLVVDDEATCSAMPWSPPGWMRVTLDALRTRVAAMIAGRGARRRLGADYVEKVGQPFMRPENQQVHCLR